MFSVYHHGRAIANSDQRSLSKFGAGLTPIGSAVFFDQAVDKSVGGVTVAGKMGSVRECNQRFDREESNTVTTPEAAPITLDQFLKTTGLVGTGGQAKIAIQEGYVTVNGELETRRRRKLALGDVIVVDNEHKFVVTEEAIRRF